MLCSEINKLINSVWNKEELPQKLKESVIVTTCKKGDKTVISVEEYHCYQLLATFYPVFSSRG
jgi:hypothetical protein